MEEEIQETRIRKVGILSVANLFGIVNVIVGFLIGLFLTIAALISSSLSTLIGLGSFGVPAYLLVLIVPILYGIMGFVAGAIMAFIYNIAAKVTKGIKLYS
jgi:hypothetical protein